MSAYAERGFRNGSVIPTIREAIQGEKESRGEYVLMAERGCLKLCSDRRKGISRGARERELGFGG